MHTFSRIGLFVILIAGSAVSTDTSSFARRAQQNSEHPPVAWYPSSYNVRCVERSFSISVGNPAYKIVWRIGQQLRQAARPIEKEARIWRRPLRRRVRVNDELQILLPLAPTAEHPDVRKFDKTELAGPQLEGPLERGQVWRPSPSTHKHARWHCRRAKDVLLMSWQLIFGLTCLANATALGHS